MIALLPGYIHEVAGAGIAMALRTGLANQPGIMHRVVGSAARR
jgi:hypothetical protein